MSEAERAVTALIDLMARLRDPERGCPWDQKQTFATIAPYTIEEAYEVADAIEKGEPEKIRDELGDLLFQVVFHARMAEERGWFDFARVASSIHDKLVRRHPHVFAGKVVDNESELSRSWEEQKARERGNVGVLADVPRGLPALVRAAKLGKRAGRVGFDWPDARGVREKVLEELREVDEALEVGSAMGGGHAAASGASGGVGPAGSAGVAGGDRAAGVGGAGSGGADAAGGAASPAVVEEMGDLLFAVANWSRHLKVDAEDALRAANSKFERRFRAMETLARERGLALEELSAETWEHLWQEAKKCEVTAAAAPVRG
jgi:ATP diphosphatase